MTAVTIELIQAKQTELAAMIAQLQAMAEELVQLAQTAGLVLTVEQVNLQPPAMGNYITVVSVRPARTPS